MLLSWDSKQCCRITEIVSRLIDAMKYIKWLFYTIYNFIEFRLICHLQQQFLLWWLIISISIFSTKTKLSRVKNAFAERLLPLIFSFNIIDWLNVNYWWLKKKLNWIIVIDKKWGTKDACLWTLYIPFCFNDLNYNAWFPDGRYSINKCNESKITTKGHHIEEEFWFVLSYLIFFSQIP